MIRFRNPGTDFSTQIQVIKHLYKELGSQSSFSLDDMAVVIAKSRLMTAYGYAGEQAIKLSNTDQDSLNSAKMNAKMYAEVFRMLGWITPSSETSSYPLTFTYLGIHVAESNDDCSALYEQCVLGINNPTQLTNNMHYIEKTRFFKCALRSLIDLGGTMYKHELCLGPMNVNDLDENEYIKMIDKIKNLRGNYENLRNSFQELADSLGMKTGPVDNCTRLPIAFMKSCGWVESITDKTLYNKTMVCIKITKHGIDVYNSIKNMKDIRLEEFEGYSTEIQGSLIRLGIYAMLFRAGYNLEDVKEQIFVDKAVCRKILKGQDILFSPCQTIRRKQVESALGIVSNEQDISSKNMQILTQKVERNADPKVLKLDLNIKENAPIEMLTMTEDYNFLSNVKSLQENGFKTKDIVNKLFEKYKDSTQNTFYPLISTLFKTMGLKCSFSRAGDNGSRWDAIIEDEQRSIPIEIKSPTEETHLSIKAIRQALENKIILLSRKTFITDKETSSLAVGYYLPNNRAEVVNLIDNIKATFGYKIGVIDFKSLLSIAVSILVDGIGFDVEKLFNLEGLCNADIQ